MSLRGGLRINVGEGHQGHTALLVMENPVGYQAMRQQEKQQGAASAGGRPTLTVSQQNALAAKRKSKAMAIASKPGQAIIMNGACV